MILQRDMSADCTINVTTYKWNIAGNGATIVSGHGSRYVTVLFSTAFTTVADLTVSAVNDCGESKQRKKKITKGTAPAKPSVVSGAIAGVCGETNVPYSVVDVPGMTYTWSFSSTLATIDSGQGQHAIAASFTAANITGYFNVTATNGCGTSSIRKSSTIKGMPATPGAISGPSSPCPNEVNVPYSVTPVPYATSYSWTAPNGATISDGFIFSAGNTLTTPSYSVTINFGSSGGTVKVKANKSCGSGGQASRAVNTGCNGFKIGADSEAPATLAGDDIMLYPNPATERIYVQLQAGENAVYKMKVVDALGRSITSLEKDVAAGVNRLEVDISTLSSGVYYLMLQPEQSAGNAKTYHKKFIVQ
ncbi:MAG: T9SS type A sorting domain-containing protein [Sphingobacteriales bacterium]|nr:MAG: T9SS type A sorting domain-containing protein [Sphingobacteriales bacterium]